MEREARRRGEGKKRTENIVDDIHAWRVATSDTVVSTHYDTIKDACNASRLEQPEKEEKKGEKSGDLPVLSPVLQPVLEGFESATALILG